MKPDLLDAKALFIHIPTSLTKISKWVCGFDGFLRTYILLFFFFSLDLCAYISFSDSVVLYLHTLSAVGSSFCILEAVTDIQWNVNLHLMARLNLLGQPADASSFSNGPVLQWVKHYLGSNVHIGVIVDQVVWVKRSLIDSIVNIWRESHAILFVFFFVIMQSFSVVSKLSLICLLYSLNAFNMKWTFLCILFI